MNKEPGKCGIREKSDALHMTKQVDYALLFLAALSKSSGSLSVQCIANTNRVSFTFLQKIAQNLKKAKLISARRGKQGGYALVRASKDITLQEVIEAVRGPFSSPVCEGERECSNTSLCRIRKSLRSVVDDMYASALSRTLAEL